MERVRSTVSAHACVLEALRRSRDFFCLPPVFNSRAFYYPKIHSTNPAGLTQAKIFAENKTQKKASPRYENLEIWNEEKKIATHWWNRIQRKFWVSAKCTKHPKNYNQGICSNSYKSILQVENRFQKVKILFCWVIISFSKIKKVLKELFCNLD